MKADDHRPAAALHRLIADDEETSIAKNEWLGRACRRLTCRPDTALLARLVNFEVGNMVVDGEQRRRRMPSRSGGGHLLSFPAIVTAAVHRPQDALRTLSHAAVVQAMSNGERLDIRRARRGLFRNRGT